MSKKQTKKKEEKIWERGRTKDKNYGEGKNKRRKRRRKSAELKEREEGEEKVRRMRRMRRM